MVHFFKCEYNDLDEFEWPVVLDDETLTLWSDVSCLQNLNFIIHNDVERKKFATGVLYTLHADVKLKQIVSDTELVDLSNYEFCNVKQLLKSKSMYDDRFSTMLEQYFYYQLPHYLYFYLNDIKLICLFDIQNYRDILLDTNVIRKYWLFRFKIITCQYKGNKNNKDILTVCDNLIDNIHTQFNRLNEYKEIDKIHAHINFNKLLKGSVGLMEILLQWR
nr:hypothetical protein Datr000030 [Darna trima granulovirus]